MRRQVLRFVDNKECIRQAAAADVGQRCDYQTLVFQHLVNLVHFLAVGAKLMLDNAKVVEQRHHIRPDFLFHVARKET